MKECPACHRCFADHSERCPVDGGELAPSLAGDPVLDNRYRLEQSLGHGGMGVVFKAQHIYLKTTHAIKVILPDLVGNDPSLVTRFRQEAMAAAAIRHPNVVAVTDYGIASGSMPFLVMEFIQGRSLYDVLAAEGKLVPGRALEMMAAICAGVGAAHDRGIVHRDLKPLNIMLQDDVPIGEAVKVLDFGLAKIKSGELLASFVQARTTGPMGSPYYMAPEQWSDEEPDPHTDIYSLGVILYQMLAGDVPFKGLSAPSIMKKHLADEPPSFVSLGVDVPPAIEATVRHALEKDSAERPPSVRALLDELRDAVAYEALGRTHASTPVNETAAELAKPPSRMTGGRLVDTIGAEGPPGASIKASGRRTEEADRLAREAAETRLLPEEKRKQAEQAARQQTEEESARRAGREPAQRSRGEETGRAPEEERSVVRQSTGAGGPPEPAQPTRQQSQPPPYTSAPGLGVSEKMGSRKLIISFAVLLSALLGGLTYFSWNPSLPRDAGRRDGVSAEKEAGPPQPSPAVSAKPEMVEIPAGRFRIGRNDGPELEKPAHLVNFPKFFIGRKEVTNNEYGEFVLKTDRKPPEGWSDGKPPAGEADRPVRNVSFADAQEFAKWRSGVDGVTYRLPTEDEWEYAARGGREDNLYPWGNEWVDGCANVDADSPKPVGSYAPCASPWGLFDVIGNVWEWTSSQASFYPDPDPHVIKYVPPQEQGWIIIRGGSYQMPQPKRMWRRYYPPATKHPPLTWRQWHQRTTTHPTIGFRLMRPDDEK